jgi:hypothetical protein
MPQEPKQPAPPAQDDVDKFLTEQKTLETHRQELIKELLHQKEAAIKAKLGYDGARSSKRSHHRHDAEKKSE